MWDTERERWNEIVDETIERDVVVETEAIELEEESEEEVEEIVFEGIVVSATRSKDAVAVSTGAANPSADTTRMVARKSAAMADKNGLESSGGEEFKRMEEK